MTIETLLNSLLISDANSLGLLDIFLAILLPFILSFPITIIYQHTQKTNNYSLAFIHSVFLFSCLSSVMTLIIGSNIARAFGLIGALSIIRFRNSLKSPIDAVYIFWALAVGMACGTGYYLAAFLIVAMVTAFAYSLHVTGYGISRYFDAMVRVYVEQETEVETINRVERRFRERGLSFQKVNVIMPDKGGSKAYVYAIRSKSELTDALSRELVDISGVHNVSQVSSSPTVFAA